MYKIYIFYFKKGKEYNLIYNKNKSFKIMKKIFSFIKSIFTSGNVEVKEVEAVAEPVTEKSLDDLKEVLQKEEPTKEIEERLLEVVKEEKPASVKEIKAKAKKPVSKETKEVTSDVSEVKAVKKPNRRRPSKPKKSE